MRFGVTLPNCGVGDNPQTVIDLAVEAEDAGWDAVLVWDFPIGGRELGDVHEAWALLAAMAVRTQALLLGTLITPLAWRSPQTIAKQASTMQALSRGRFVLSVGLGYPPEDGTYFYEPDDRRTRARMLDEGLAIMRGLWSGEPLSHDGEFYRVRNAPVMLPVVEPRPTVWVVGAWQRDPKTWTKQRSFRRTLQWDGILPHVFDGDKMAEGDIAPDDLRAMYADVARERSEPFDVIIESGSRGEKNTPAERVAAIRDAGATWWLEPVWWQMYAHPGDPSYVRARVREGPPKLF